MRVGVSEARKRLSELLKIVEAGEKIIICRRGEPVVELVRATKPAKRKLPFGMLSDRIIIHDPNWWKAMTDEEVESFLETGSY